MKMQFNPFIVTGYFGPEYFCDRETEAKTVMDALENGRNVSLISPRRMGKTGLVHHIFNSLSNEKNLICIYVDIFSTQNLYDFTKIFAKAILSKIDSVSILKKVSSFFSNLRPIVSFDPITNSPQIGIELQDNKSEIGLQEIFEYLKKSDKQYYICIDEFQQITEYPEKGIEALLRSYIQFLPNVRFIFAGSKKHIMATMFSSVNRPFYQSTQKIGLKPIPQKIYYDFASNLFSKIKKTLDEELFNYVYDLMLGHTWYIQYILNRLYSINKTKYSIIDIDNIIKETIEEENATYKTYCELLSNGQLRLLIALAKEKRVKTITEYSFISKYRLSAPSSIRQAIQVLIDKSLVLKDDDHGDYYVYDRFFSHWLSQ